MLRTSSPSFVSTVVTRGVFPAALCAGLSVSVACDVNLGSDGGTDADAGDDAGIVDAGVDRFADYGEPIPATAGEWTYTVFDEARCGNDTPVGVMVNPSPSETPSGRVVVYMEGGGACWSAITCNNNLATFTKTGITEADAQQFVTQLGSTGLFNRSNPDNPFKDDDFVYIPYCTGDLHAGKQPTTAYGVSHVGANNVEAFLNRVVPTFPDAKEVVLTGTSGGAFGAMLNYERVKELFIDLPVRLLIDSAPPMTTNFIKPELQTQQRTAWNLDASVPTGCTTCTDLFSTFKYSLDQDPNLQVGLISSTADRTLRFFFGLGYTPITNMPAADYRAGLDELRTLLVPYANVRTYYIEGEQHVWLYSEPLGSVTVANTSLTNWLRGFMGVQSPWENVGP